jgi:predicted metalloendopeptidase
VIFLSGAVVGVHEAVGLIRPANEAVEPGEDFFTYANRDWLDQTRIPAGKGRWGARDEIAAATAQQVAEVIRDARSQADGAQVAAFFAAYQDEAAIEKNSAGALTESLAEIDRIQDAKDLSRHLGANLQADVDPFGVGVYNSAQLFGFAASYGLHGDYVPYLTQGGLGLGDRDAYLADTPEKELARRSYSDYIALMLASAGFDDAMRRARDVLGLETAIARTHATSAQSSQDSNARNYWARGDFTQEAPGLDWRAFFAAAGLSRRGDFVVWQPQAIKGAAQLVASRPIPVWKDYLRFHLLDHEADVLPSRFAKAAQAFHRAPARRQRAIDATSRLLPGEVGRLYVKRHFPPESKARVQAIVDRVVAASKQRVANAAWMSPQARKVALAKLDTVYFGVGYPDEWPDMSALVLDRHDALANQRAIERWRYANARAKLGREVDRREWAIAPHTPGGLLNFQLNTYNFTAALLQPPRFDPDASEAANYGSIGAIFAHEVSHFVDTLGADYDAQGLARAWWTADDKARFTAVSQALVDQYSAYRPVPDLAVDGKLTLVENTADLVGLATAFDAYRAAMGANADPKALRASDREFFVAFARSWRSKLTDDALRAQLKGDGHAPDPFHVATVRNLDAWYEAFDVKPGQRLYLAPGERVRPW